MAIVWLWFDQVLQIGGEVGGDHMVVAQHHCTTSSYTEQQQLEYHSSYTEKQLVEYKSSYTRSMGTRVHTLRNSRYE